MRPQVGADPAHERIQTLIGPSGHTLREGIEAARTVPGSVTPLVGVDHPGSWRRLLLYQGPWGIEGKYQGKGERGALRGLRVSLRVVIAIEVPVRVCTIHRTDESETRPRHERMLFAFMPVSSLRATRGGNRASQ